MPTPSSAVCRGGGRRRDRARADRGHGSARGHLPRPGQPGQLPDRHADDVHDDADAVGPAPGRLPARGRRRGFSAFGAIDGDDIAARPWVGDRDPRSEDRQLLLDAVMAAQEHLLVIYSGADPRTGEPTPPAVPIGALLDTLDLTARTADGGRPRCGHRPPSAAALRAARTSGRRSGREPFSFDRAPRGARGRGGSGRPDAGHHVATLPLRRPSGRCC